ncbi:alcohol dehydrogenase catalytic domain-containing protein [Rhizobium etli]|uniref:alcohol dehydrogenase catalytic domain-containing protein n=1 Tax=Rhizobium etli TaxID=29449 RepID=UPI003B84872B
MATVLATGEGTLGRLIGQKVWVPWLGNTCGHCLYCREGRENLCDAPASLGTPSTAASQRIRSSRRAACLAGDTDPVAIAPLLCTGLIGWRSLRWRARGMIGIYGFGAAAHERHSER